MSDFKLKYSLEHRKKESNRILKTHKDKVPVIISKASKICPISILDKNKFIVPNDLTVAQFLFVIRKHLPSIKPHEGLFLYLEGSNDMPITSDSMKSVYERYVHEDGFLYIKISGESVFG